MRDLRPLSARLDAYIANLQSIADQLDELAATIEAHGTRGQKAALPEFRSGVKFYRLAADDLTKIVNGERLADFRVEGTLDVPPTEGDPDDA